MSGGSGNGGTSNIPHFVRLDFADATRAVFYVMAAVMALAGVIALLGLQRGRQVQPATEQEPSPVSDPTG